MDLSYGSDKYTFGSDGKINEFLLSDYSIHLIPIDYKKNSALAHPLCSLNCDDEMDRLSTYVPFTLATVSQLMLDTGLPFANATRLAAKLPALHAYAKAKYAPFIVSPSCQVESFIDFDELLSVYDVPLQVVESFIDFDELLSVYDTPLLPHSFNAFMLNNDSNDVAISLSSFDNSPPMSPLSESIVPPLTVSSLFYLDFCPLVAVFTKLFSDEIKPFSIGFFFEFSKFECHCKWKIYRFSLPPVVIFISWIFLTCSLSFGLI